MMRKSLMGSYIHQRKYNEAKKDSQGKHTRSYLRKKDIKILLKRTRAPIMYTKLHELFMGSTEIIEQQRRVRDRRHTITVGHSLCPKYIGTAPPSDMRNVFFKA